MLKELLLAIILGALLGFGITGGYLAINKKTETKNNYTDSVIESPTPTIENSDQENTSTDNDGFSLTSIEDLDIVSDEDLEIKGKTTSPNNTVIATLDDQIANTTSDENGDFSLSVELNSGLNNIKITVIDLDSNQFEKTINITYSTAKI